MPRRVKKPLTDAEVRNAKPGTLYDGNGLVLVVKSETSAYWVLRYDANGRRREAGLGPARGPGRVSLSQARQLAEAKRVEVRAGRDPIDARAAAASERRAAREHTFAAALDKLLDTKGGGWKSAKHRDQWRATLDYHAAPRIGHMPVKDITSADVLAVLQPIWSRIPETASRVRQRIEAVLSYAGSLGWRDPERRNPAVWKDNLEHLLPTLRKLKKRKRLEAGRGENFAALPWRKVPELMPCLARRKGIGALALRFAILTAARSGEVRGMVWSEVDLEARVWRVPELRMKAEIPHSVPLTDAAVEILEELMPLALDADGRLAGDALVFPGSKVGRPLSDNTLRKIMLDMDAEDAAVGGPRRWLDEWGRVATPHGFRSSFKDWARAGKWPDDYSETALAHVDPNETRAAYARDKLLEERRPMMREWAAFCDGGREGRTISASGTDGRGDNKARVGVAQHESLDAQQDRDASEAIAGEAGPIAAPATRRTARRRAA